MLIQKSTLLTNPIQNLIFVYAHIHKDTTLHMNINIHDLKIQVFDTNRQIISLLCDL